MLRVFRDPEGRLTADKRALVFGLTWVSYATYYLARMNFGVCKTTLASEFGLTQSNLANIDTGYLVAYAAGQFLSGAVGDRLGGRKLVGIGMLVSGGASAAFGLSSAGVLFGIAFIVNGIFQATGWPGNLKSMGSWFGTRERGVVMGVWATSFQVGPLAATFLATWLLAKHSWRAAFLGPALGLAIVAVAVLILLPEPERAPGPSPERQGSVAPAVSSWRVLREPALWSIGSAYFCLKLIRYSILFWLPWYLEKEIHYSKELAGYLSTSFTVGGVVGSIGVGFISDRYFRGERRQIASWMVVVLAVALVAYPHVAAWGMVANFSGMALVGFFLFGPDALISGAAAQDLGGADATAMAGGAINGMGSIGGIFSRVTTPISTAYGWTALFYVFAGLAIVAAAGLRLIQPSRRT